MKYPRIITFSNLKGELRQYAVDFFTTGDQRSIEAKKNIVASFGIKCLSIAINLILVPLTIHYLNPTKYGIWLTLSSIIIWFGLLDIGFGNGLRNKFAEAKATGNIDQVRIYVSTTYAVLALIFSAVWILFFSIHFFIDWSKLLNVPEQMNSELSILALIVFGFFCMQNVLKIINILLTADQKPARSSFLEMLGQLLALLIIVILINTTRGSLLYLGLAMGITPVLVLIFSSLILYRNKYKYYAPSLKYIKFNYARDTMPLGVMFFIIQISIIVIFQTSNIIIAQICGSESVTIYNVAYKYFSISYILFSIIILPFWSAFTDASSRNEYIWMKRVLKTLETIAFIVVIFIILLLIFSKFIFILWLHHVVEIKASVSVLVALFFITQIYHGLYTPLLNGMGKIKLQFYVNSILTILILPLSIVLGRKFGLEGIIVAPIIANLVIALYAPLQVHMLINKKAKGVWDK